MDKRELILTLHKLHEELDRHPQLDEPARESLRQIADEIDELLGKDEPVPASQTSPMHEKLSQWASRLESEHPHLTRALINVSNVLAQIGI